MDFLWCLKHIKLIKSFTKRASHWRFRSLNIVTHDCEQTLKFLMLFVSKVAGVYSSRGERDVVRSKCGKCGDWNWEARNSQSLAGKMAEGLSFRSGCGKPNCWSRGTTNAPKIGRSWIDFWDWSITMNPGKQQYNKISAPLEHYFVFLWTFRYFILEESWSNKWDWGHHFPRLQHIRSFPGWAPRNAEPWCTTSLLFEWWAAVKQLVVTAPIKLNLPGKQASNIGRKRQ